MHTFALFIRDNLPTPATLLTGGPAGILWALVCLWLAGYLKREKGFKTGYTRKVFHFLIFFTAAFLQAFKGTPAVCLFGAMASLVIFYAVWRGPGNLLYEAMAREKDEPHGSLYIIIPYFATLIGGILSAMFFGRFAVVGLLVTGVGDAAGEPVGTRFGRHAYRVPSMFGVPCTRTYEGSLAVFMMSTLAALLGFAMLPELNVSPTALLIILLIGAASALCEALSPHGWDNATMQLIPSWLAYVLAT